MEFGEAIKHLKAGEKITRKHWKEKGMFIFLANGKDIKRCIGVKDECIDVICMKTSQSTVVLGWFALQTDILSEDWEVVTV